MEIVKGKTTPRAAREVGITEQTYYRWRKEFAGLKLDHPSEAAQGVGERERPVEAVGAELSLEKQGLRDVAQGNF